MIDHVQGDGQLQDVVKADLRSHTAILMNPQVKTHFWALALACGHTVERWIRWKPGDHRHGYAAMHRAPELSRLPEPPKRARCKDEKRGTP